MFVARPQKLLNIFFAALVVLVTIILPTAMGAIPSQALADHQQTVFFEAPSQLLNPAQRSGAIKQLQARPQQPPPSQLRCGESRKL
jgi:hypothetical protein